MSIQRKITVLLTVVTLAVWHVVDFINTEYWSHTLSDGTTFNERVNEVGLVGYTYGEVLYKGSCSLPNAISLWEESDTHSKIINDEEYQYMSLLMVPYENEKCFIAGLYAKRNNINN